MQYKGHKVRLHIRLMLRGNNISQLLKNKLIELKNKVKDVNIILEYFDENWDSVELIVKENGITEIYRSSDSCGIQYVT